MSEKKIKPINIITDGMNPVIKKHMEGVYYASSIISGMVWFETGEGTVIIDTLINIASAMKVITNINEEIKYVIYTHGHADHVGGAKVFINENTEVIASKYLPERFDRYKLLRPYRDIIAAMQFNLPTNAFGKGVNEYVYPTKTILGDFSFTLGKYTFELHTSRGETDDAVWVYIPEIKTAVVGDFILGYWFPNVGNPWKPTRFALDWVNELERIRALEPESLFCSGGGVLFKGKEAIKVLDENIEVIRSLHDQVVKYINEGMHITEMIHKVKIPEHLEKSPFLKQVYSRPEFFVYNVYRWYHGYYDHNPAHLIPRPEKEVMKEIYDLIGDKEIILSRINDLFENEQYQLALQILDIIIQSEPENIEALKKRIELLKKLAQNDTCVMSKNAYFYSIKKDKQFIRQKQRELREKLK
ncbi:MAG: alkyl sulfatase dimerization domain-containing protein [Candidatus Hermodarchaeota archaeon]